MSEFEESSHSVEFLQKWIEREKAKNPPAYVADWIEGWQQKVNFWKSKNEDDE